MRDLIHTQRCFQNIPLNFGKDLKNRFFSLSRKKEVHYSLWRKYRHRTDWWVSYNQSSIARQLSKSHDEHVPTHSHEFSTQIDINESLLDFFFNPTPAEKRKKRWMMDKKLHREMESFYYGDGPNTRWNKFTSAVCGLYTTFRATFWGSLLLLLFLSLAHMMSMS